MSAHSRAQTRELDDLHLAWLRLADAGVSRAEIARRYDRSEGAVKKQVALVRREFAASETRPS